MDEHDQHTVETYKSMITISVEALKTLLLLNGGAIVALGSKVDISKTPTLPHSVRWAAISFVLGLFLTALGFWGSYLTQITLYNESLGREVNGRHMLWMNVTGLLAAASLLLFLVGSIVLVVAFT